MDKAMKTLLKKMVKTIWKKVIHFRDPMNSYSVLIDSSHQMKSYSLLGCLYSI